MSEILQMVDNFSLPLDLWAVHLFIGGTVDINIPPHMISKLKSLPIPHEIMHHDLQHAIDNEGKSDNDNIATIDPKQLMQINNLTLAPAFFDNYRSDVEYVTFLRAVAQSYPSKAQFTDSIGLTTQNRNIFAIRITSGNAANKIKIVYNSLQHAREWVSGSTVAYIAYMLTTDDKYASLLDKIEFILIPIVNVDGYVYSRTTDRMWRKNRRANQGSTCIGVDTNRNWGYMWNTGGASANPCAETYRGINAFSEVETTVVADFITKLTNCRGYVDFHSYSQLWMNPWGYAADLPAADATQKALAREVVSSISKVHGLNYGHGNSFTVIYQASGGADDWTYGSRKIDWSYSVELRDTGRYGFNLPANQIVPQGEEIMAAVQVMAQFIINASN